MRRVIALTVLTIGLSVPAAIMHGGQSTRADADTLPPPDLSVACTPSLGVAGWASTCTASMPTPVGPNSVPGGGVLVKGPITFTTTGSAGSFNSQSCSVDQTVDQTSCSILYRPTTSDAASGSVTITAYYSGDSGYGYAPGSASTRLVVLPSNVSSLLNDTASGLIYSGTWTYSSNRGAGDNQDDVHHTSSAWSSFGDYFTGTGVEVIGETTSYGGNDEVYVDGADKGTISTYSSTHQCWRVLYSISGLSSGTHEVKVVDTSGTTLNIDALAILQ